MHESRIRLLVLYAQYTSRLSYYDDWQDAFTKYPAFHTKLLRINAPGAIPATRATRDNVDAIILLHSTNGDTTAYLEPLASILADRRAPLLAFVGNEINLPGSPISAKRRLFATIRPDWIATQLLEEAGRFLFGDLVRRAVVTIPHALNPDVFKPTRRLEDRTIDIGTRLSHYLPHVGDNDRNRLVDAFVNLGTQGKLRIDISGDRYERDVWSAFLNRCKGTVATESGSWFLERDDATVNAIRAHVRRHSGGLVMIRNDSPLRKLGHMLPWRARSILRRALSSGPFRHESAINEQIAFHDIYPRFFSGRPKAPVYGKCISSRHFDAIGTKTCQIMIRGRFNNILEPDRHYLALDSDLRNIDDVLRRFSDISERRLIVDQAHTHVLAAHTYVHRMGQVAKILDCARPSLPCH